MTKLMLAGLTLWLWGTPSLAGDVLVKQTAFAQVAAQSGAARGREGPELDRAPQAASASSHLAQLIRLHREATTPWMSPPNP